MTSGVCTTIGELPMASTGDAGRDFSIGLGPSTFSAGPIPLPLPHAHRD
jgi:hypothetical protein